jgi:hypothetical protein
VDLTSSSAQASSPPTLPLTSLRRRLAGSLRASATWARRYPGMRCLLRLSPQRARARLGRRRLTRTRELTCAKCFITCGRPKNGAAPPSGAPAAQLCA